MSNRYGPSPPGPSPTCGRGGRDGYSPGAVSAAQSAPPGWAYPALAPAPRRRRRAGCLCLIGLLLFSCPGLGGAGFLVDSYARGQARINILLMGIDQRLADQGQPTRTDTMQILTLEPATRRLGMLAIPRDLWVEIADGSGRQDRINTAYFWGELNNYEGGGPALARRTVEQNFGLPIQHYAVVNFQTFQKIVDAVDGVDIDVPRTIVDTAYPTDDYGIQTVRFDKGLQHLDGARALQYVRTRHADSDLGRNARQQQVIKAALQKATSPGYLPRLFSLFTLVESEVKTSLNRWSLIGLGIEGLGADIGAIDQRRIDESMVEYRSVNGAQVLIPNWERITPLVTDLFADHRGLS